MTYHFDSIVAKEYGVDEAILISNLQYWITKNKANDRHVHDGHTWTYNSINAFCRLFPFWSEKQIRRILQSLLDKNIIITGQFNNHWSDHTKWYAFKDECKWIKLPDQNVCNDLPEQANQNCPNGQMSGAQTGNSISTNNKPDDTPNNPPNPPNRPPPPLEVIKMVKEFWNAYPKKHNLPDTERAFTEVKGWLFLPAILKTLEWQKKDEAWSNYKFIPMPASYLRDMRWLDQPTAKAKTLEEKLNDVHHARVRAICSAPLPDL